MAHNSNGSGSGEDHGQKLVKFPDPAERERLRKTKIAQDNEKKEREAQFRVQYQIRQKAQQRAGRVPFFNFSKIPPFTGGMIVIFLAVHAAISFLLAPPAIYDVFMRFGFVPAAFLSGGITAEKLASLITHQFIHGGWMHVLFNGMSMLVMGMFFEKMYGARRTAFFFFVCGIAGALVYFAFNPHSQTPIIGASGGISGLFGAVTILLFQQRPQAQFSKRGPWPLVAFWLLFMIGMGSIGGEALAWQAHVGGFLAGIAMLRVMQKSFQKNL